MTKLMICLFTFVLRGPTALSPIFIFGPVAKDQTVFWVMESVRELKRGLGRFRAVMAG
jgi:hypothetical protein